MYNGTFLPMKFHNFTNVTAALINIITCCSGILDSEWLVTFKKKKKFNVIQEEEA